MFPATCLIPFELELFTFSWSTLSCATEKDLSWMQKLFVLEYKLYFFLMADDMP